MNERATIVITGATGFLGRQVLQLLIEKGYNIHAIGRNNPILHSPLRGEGGFEQGDKTDEGVIYHQYDLLNQTLPQKFWNDIKPTHFHHLAWEARPGHFWNAPENDIWLEKSKLLVDGFIASGGKHLIAAGTCAEYDWLEPTTIPWNETHPCKPATLYGQTKYALFEYCTEQAKTHDVLFAWGRLFNMFGENEPREKLVASICNALVQNQTAKCTIGTQKLDYVDVKYAALAFAKLVESNVSGAVNIGSGIEISLAEIAQELGQISGKPQLIQLGAIPTREDTVRYMIADVSRLKNELEMPYANLRNDLRILFEWWKSSL